MAIELQVDTNFSSCQILGGSNERLFCKFLGSPQQIDCVMVVEGNKFAEFTILIHETTKNASERQDLQERSLDMKKYNEYRLEVNSTKNYSHYLNSVCEQIDFSDKFILMQASFPATSNSTEVKRSMLVFNRKPGHSQLYMGILCKEYSTSCNGPVNVIVGSTGRDFYVAVENDNNLVTNFTFKERRFIIPSRSELSSINYSEYRLRATNAFNSKDMVSESLSSVINFSDPTANVQAYFSWIFAVLGILPLWLVAFVVLREFKDKKLKDKQDASLSAHLYERLEVLRTESPESSPENDSSKTMQLYNNISLMEKSRPKGSLREISEYKEPSEQVFESYDYKGDNDTNGNM
jgi:hypothetical protein